MGKKGARIKIGDQLLTKREAVRKQLNGRLKMIVK